MLNTEYKFGEVHDLASQVEYGNERVNFRSILRTVTVVYRFSHSKPDKTWQSILLPQK